ncbi:MAG: DNA polymerase Y family protein [Bacteroidia bacterium]
MSKRIVVIWFPHLITDWMLRQQPLLKGKPFALAMNESGRRVVKAVNTQAHKAGVYPDMVVADCRALVPELQLFDYNPEQPEKLLTALAEWFIRYSPLVSVYLPDCLIMDVSGCTHLWGGEEEYIKNIAGKLNRFGYTNKIAMANTIGTAWAVCKYGNKIVVQPGAEAEELSVLPSEGLRLEQAVLERLAKLGLKTIGSFMYMDRVALRRRFGIPLLKRLDQALGAEPEALEPIREIAAYEEHLPSMEPIRTAPGIEIALKDLLSMLCLRLQQESKGLRKCQLNCYRVDGNVQTIEIGTNKPSRNTLHLFKLFELKIPKIEPDLGIELFVLKSTVVEDLHNTQDALWTVSNKNEAVIAELLDRLGEKNGVQNIYRYLPDEHYWPERSFKLATSLSEKPSSEWRTDLPRPLHLLSTPQPIEVSVPLPDYPPLLFVFRGAVHRIQKSDGPERIEQEWWIQAGLYRDYYCLEDEQGARYWVFRAGDYNTGNPQWFIHGFFA